MWEVGPSMLPPGVELGEGSRAKVIERAVDAAKFKSLGRKGTPEVWLGGIACAGLFGIQHEQAVAQHHQAAVDARTSVGRDDSLDCPENQNLKKPDKVI